MTSVSVIKHRIHQTVAESILSEIQSGQARWYYFLGRTLNFQGGQVEIPNSNLVYEARTRSDIIAIMAINSSDVSFVLPRVDWTPGTVYGMYDDILDENISNFYVLDVNTNNVYKCLDNNYWSQSTVRPTNSDVEPFMTSDGYKWKFMYNIPLALRNKFLTNTYMPVSNALRNRFFSNGGIELVSIDSPGSNYTQNTTSISVVGDGTGAAITPVIQSGQLVDVVITNPGVGYTFANIEVKSTRLTASGARVSVNLSRGDINSPQSLSETLATPGTIDTILVTAPGSNYTVPPTVTIIGDGIGRTATATINNGVVTRINVNNPGSGYTVASVVLTGTATARPIISPPKGHGRDAITELHARTLMFYANIVGERIAGFDVNNDYRQIGIIRNPRTHSFSSRIVNTVSRGHFAVTGVAPILLDQFPIGTTVFDGVGDSYTVSSVQRLADGTGGLVLFSANNKEIAVGTIMNRVSPNISFTVSDVQDRQQMIAQTATSAYVVTPVSFVHSLYPIDTILTSNNRRYTIIANDGIRLLVLPQDNGILSPGNVLNIEGTGTNFTIQSLIEPAFDRRTGDMLFIDNRLPFSQLEDQAVTLRTVIQY